MLVRAAQPYEGCRGISTVGQIVLVGWSGQFVVWIAKQQEAYPVGANHYCNRFFRDNQSS